MSDGGLKWLAAHGPDGAGSIIEQDGNSLMVLNGVNFVSLGDDNSLTLLGGDNWVRLHDGNTATIVGGNNIVRLHDDDSVTISGGGNVVRMHDNDTLTITGGGNLISMHEGNSLTIVDARSEANGFTGSVSFGDTVTAASKNTIALDYSLTLGNSDIVSVDFAPLVTAGASSTVAVNNSITAGKSDVIIFAGSGQQVLLNLGKGDTLVTTGSNDTITIGGTATTKSSALIGATAPGTTFNGGLGTDTFTAGSGYTGGNQYIGSPQDYQAGFNAIGTCANYAGSAIRVTVDDNLGVGQGFDASGNLLWTDTYNNIQQIKAGDLDGNILTGSDAFFCELKGGSGQTSFYDGAGGARILWSSAGATGQLDGQSNDIAHIGNGPDELYWRNQPGGKGVSNFGETVYGFNAAQGDDLNFSEYATAGFAGVTNAFTFSDLSNWVSVSMSSDGLDTNVWFDRTGTGNFAQLGAVLMNTDLFAVDGVADYSSVGAQQVVQDLYSSGQLVLTQPH